ncbi:MAG: hypothetical protein D6806_13310 [Deltaproteobacteria bacterium]|nr:MAG: hypothetical protein D6806_13310 [Deltaproteobacteria bacterium]
MIELDVPGWGKRRLEHLVCDFNGTIARDGQITAEAEELLARVSIKLRVHLCTADHFGTVERQTSRIQLALKILRGTDLKREKVEFVRRLGPLKVVAMGNGWADAAMLHEATLGICVLGAEGASPATLSAADIVCRSAEEALELLLHPQRIAATLRR